MIEFTPIQPELLSAEDAARFLLLDQGRDMSAAIKALNRLVDKGKVRPVIVGKHRRYAVAELRRYINDETERYGPQPEALS